MVLIINYLIFVYKNDEHLKNVNEIDYKNIFLKLTEHMGDIYRIIAHCISDYKLAFKM